MRAHLDAIDIHADPCEAGRRANLEGFPGLAPIEKPIAEKTASWLITKYQAA
jgi:hypothetical protein